jgi:hypothetical protein
MLNCGTRCLVQQYIARKLYCFSWSFTVVRLYSNSKSCPLIYKIQYQLLISGFRREVAEDCALLGCYVASSGNFLPTFRDNLSVPSSGFKEPFKFLLDGALLGCHAASSGIFLPTFRDNLSVPSSGFKKPFGFLLDGALLGYYAASSGNFLPTFRGNLSASSSGFKNPFVFLLDF